MWINNYPQMIAESSEELLEQEKHLRGSPLESRVKMLRLLKDGHYRTRRSLAEVLGYSSRQLGRWWKSYQHGGLDALLEFHRAPGKQEYITQEALEILEEQMKQGNIARLEECRVFLAERLSSAVGSSRQVRVAVAVRGRRASNRREFLSVSAPPGWGVLRDIPARVEQGLSGRSRNRLGRGAGAQKWPGELARECRSYAVTSL
jgi:transposase-like protein